MAQRTRVKICGVRRPEDALAAARAGADAVGMVFHPAAPRHVSVEQARAVLDVLPAFVTPVALFVDADVGEVLKVVGDLCLRHVQLHGDETPEYVARLANLAVIKAIRVGPMHLPEALHYWRTALAAGGLPHLKSLLLDSPGAGGSGVANDWRAAREQQARGAFAGLPPLIAAGGLTPDTVGQVVRDLRPWAVDVSTGVEESRGVKSAAKIDAFVAAVRRADAEGSPS